MEKLLDSLAGFILLMAAIVIVAGASFLFSVTPGASKIIFWSALPAMWALYRLDSIEKREG